MTLRIISYRSLECPVEALFVLMSAVDSNRQSFLDLLFMDIGRNEM